MDCLTLLGYTFAISKHKLVRHATTMRGIHTKPIAQPSEEEAYQNAVSSLMRSATSPAVPAKEPSRLRSFGRRSRPVATTHQRQARVIAPTPTTPEPITGALDDEHSYRDNIFGPSRPLRKPKKSKPANVQVQLSINLKKPSIAPVKRFAQTYKTQLVRLGALGLCLMVAGGGLAIYNNRNRSDTQGVAGATYIAPKTVFLPRPVPEGYTVGSSKQELENGAVLYTVYGPSGEEITITQQSEPANFKDEVFKDALRFNTPHGIGYVIEDMERTTGFLLADESWVLINTPRGFPSDEMRTLIRSLQPI